MYLEFHVISVLSFQGWDEGKMRAFHDLQCVLNTRSYDLTRCKLGLV